MKVIIFGASGATGRELVRQAQQRGHAVTVFMRDTSVSSSNGVRLIRGDARDANAVDAAVAGREAVLSALGSRSLGRSDLLEHSCRNIIAAMKRNRVERLIVLGMAGALRDAGSCQSFFGRNFLRLLLRTLLRNVAHDQAAQERQIEASNLKYTIVLPPFLTSRPASGRYRVELAGLPARWGPISRADVASFMVEQLDDVTFVRKGPYLAT